MLETLLVLTLVNTGMLTALLFGYQWTPKEPELPQEMPEERERPFTVVFSTELGASARDTFLAQALKEGETVEFYEGSTRRSVR